MGTGTRSLLLQHTHFLGKKFLQFLSKKYFFNQIEIDCLTKRQISSEDQLLSKSSVGDLRASQPLSGEIGRSLEGEMKPAGDRSPTTPWKPASPWAT